jgi:hypothetical protein
MTSKRTKSRKVKPPKLPLSGSETLTRAEVARTLGCSIPTVRRMEGTALHPIQDADGIHRFAPIEVLQVMHERSARVVDPTTQGERDARAFEMLDAGHGVREVVTTLRLPIDVALKLSDAWKEAGRRDLIIPPACRIELEKALGLSLGGAKDAAHLAHLVRSLEVEYEQLKTEHEMMSNQMGAVLAIIGELAARYSEVEDALPDLRNELDAERSELLDRTFKYYQQRFASAIQISAEQRDRGEHV